MVDGDKSRDLSCSQTKIDITQVDAPSSIMHREIMALQTQTGIWKAIDEGNGGCSDVSTGKKIKRSSEGNIAPKVVIRAFFWEGHDWSTSSVNMATSDCTESSTLLYVWAALLEVALWLNGLVGILGMASTFG